jgi:starch synthase
VVFVSKGYAQEVLHKEMGSGLDEYLRLHVGKIHGIINGIDTDYWDPATDPYISVAFDRDNMAGKQVDKASLQQELGFVVNHDIPLLAVVSRLDNQKGLGILLEGLSRMVDLPWQLALLGTGDQALEEKALALQTAYPYRVSAAFTYDEAYSHTLYAAADILLMPSLYEPCGLSQMIAMRYGTIPVARATGGLVDTIINHFKDPENSTGFLFDQKTPEGFDTTLRRALQVYTDLPAWRALQQRAMSRNYSWGYSAREYIDLYKSIINEVE